MLFRRHAVSAALLCAAAVTACAASGAPTLQEAAQRLDADAEALIGQSHLSAVERAEDHSCLPGQVRRFVRAESDLTDDFAGLLDRLQAMGYAKIADDRDLRDGDEDVSVLRDPRTRVTFELTLLSGDHPGVQVVGKTICYATD
ncbi:hypothetical protein ACIBP6_02140 [Nonomuraea terrae]|uniref:hypothetical protein n=1 Tax=Nonomuraea terrae TaxID=2530383 RepID=UPI0037A481FD